MKWLMLGILTCLFILLDDVYAMKSKQDDIIIIGGSSGSASPVILDAGGGKGKKGSSTIIILPAQKSSHGSSHVDMPYEPPSQSYGDSMYGSASYQSMNPSPIPFYPGHVMSRYPFPGPHQMSIKANVSTRGPRSKRKKRK